MAEFPRFSQLPLEIRLKIWRSVPIETRIIEVIHFGSGQEFSSHPRPAILGVCTESRGAVLKQFVKLTSGKSSIYVHLELDTLLLRYHDDFDDYFPKLSHYGIRNLVLEDNWLHMTGQAKLISALPLLRNLVFTRISCEKDACAGRWTGNEKLEARTDDTSLEEMYMKNLCLDLKRDHPDLNIKIEHKMFNRGCTNVQYVCLNNLDSPL